MQKQIIGLDEPLSSLLGDGEEEGQMPTRRTVLRLMGNVKAANADEARRVARILNQVRDKNVPNLVLPGDDMMFLLKKFEENPMNLVSWVHGQILEVIENAEKLDVKVEVK